MTNRIRPQHLATTIPSTKRRQTSRSSEPSAAGEATAVSLAVRLRHFLLPRTDGPTTQWRRTREVPVRPVLSRTFRDFCQHGHVLTATQRASFAARGLLKLSAALDPNDARRMCDEVWASSPRPKESHPRPRDIWHSSERSGSSPARVWLSSAESASYGSRASLRWGPRRDFAIVSTHVKS